MDIIDEVVKELGGEVYVKTSKHQGRWVPTNRENYLERIRQLVDKERTANGNSMALNTNFN